MILKKRQNVQLLITSCLFAMMVLTLSCDNQKKAEDAKDIAEEHNEAKFDNTAKEAQAQFLVNAAEFNLEQIQLGMLAQQTSKTKIVVDLGKNMQEVHDGLMKELTELAGNKIITIPTVSTTMAQETYKELKGKVGNDFNNAYCKNTVDGYTNAIALFEKASNDLSDEDIKAWVRETLPKIRTHLDHAINCQKECEKLGMH